MGGKRTLASACQKARFARMEIDELASQLASIAPNSSDPAIDWRCHERLWSQLTAMAEALVASVAPEARCTAQEWDNRLDCMVRLPDGAIVGEMVVLGDLMSKRLRETAERLQRIASGERVQLIRKIDLPVHLGRPLPPGRSGRKRPVR